MNDGTIVKSINVELNEYQIDTVLAALYQFRKDSPFSESFDMQVADSTIKQIIKKRDSQC